MPSGSHTVAVKKSLAAYFDSADSSVSLDAHQISGSSYFYILNPNSKQKFEDVERSHNTDTTGINFSRSFYSSTDKFRIFNDTEVQFEKLFKLWESETQFISSASVIALNPSYQKIIGLGKPALPYLLKKLKNTDTPCFHALTAISGINVVTPEIAGNFIEIKKAWLEWGQKKNLI